jgi:hypothetical protein
MLSSNHFIGAYAFAINSDGRGILELKKKFDLYLHKLQEADLYLKTVCSILASVNDRPHNPWFFPTELITLLKDYLYCDRREKQTQADAEDILKLLHQVLSSYKTKWSNIRRETETAAALWEHLQHWMRASQCRMRAPKWF